MVGHDNYVDFNELGCLDQLRFMSTPHADELCLLDDEFVSIIPHQLFKGEIMSFRNFLYAVLIL